MTSTMLRVKLRRDDPAALHEQVASEIRRAIADGEARPGERLPPAQDLAAILDVNRNTVLRALRADLSAWQRQIAQIGWALAVALIGAIVALVVAVA